MDNNRKDKSIGETIDFRTRHLDEKNLTEIIKEIKKGGKLGEEWLSKLAVVRDLALLMPIFNNNVSYQNEYPKLYEIARKCYNIAIVYKLIPADRQSPTLF